MGKFRIPKKTIRKYQKRMGLGKYRRNPTVNVNRSLQPFAQRYISKMKYSTQLSVSGPGGTGWQTYRFNLNSIYDPDQTGLGHQPYGHDTLQTIYNRYRVIKCRYVISGIATGAGTGNQYTVIAALPSNEVHSISTIADAQEAPRCRYITQAPGAPLRMLTGTVSMPSLMGRTKAQYMADDRYQATYGTSPNELGILNVYTGSLAGLAETQTVQLNITLEYTVESFDPKILPTS